MLRSACLTFLAIVFVPATVQAFDHHHHHHGGSSHHGGGCNSSHASSTHKSSSAPPATAPAPKPKRVFVTSTAYSGALGGLDAADGFCQTAASEHGLSGRYRAWLSSDGENAYDRIIGEGPFVNTAGAQVFASRAALRDAPAADLLDETGGAPTNLGTTGAWTGSDAEGNDSGSNCAGWTDATDSRSASMGSALADDPSWGGGDAPSKCSVSAPLICFEQ